MALNIDAIKNRLNKLQNTQKKALELWKPSPGKHQIRIVPYKFNKENPFIELYFHYNINNRTYLSPISFGRPDPIVKFADKLKRLGDKEDYQTARKLYPKLRTFAPVLVRGEEGEGVRFWGFGKTVYQEILGYIADSDYGDITDIESGRDIVVELISAEDAGTSYPMTNIRVKPKETRLMEKDEEIKKMIESQVEITEVYSELSYDELKDILNGWLNPTDDEDGDDDTSTTTEVASKPDTKKSKNTEWMKDDKKDEEAPFDADEKEEKEPAKKAESPIKPDKAKKVDDVASAFDDLFS